MDIGNLASATGAEWIGVAPHQELQAKARPQLPSDDPFYEPPPGYQHAEPGTVLRSRDVELAFLGLIPQRTMATQLLYRSTDMHGNPEATATTVIVPADAAPERPCPVLSYQCAIDAVSSRCFPSYALRRYAQAVGSLAQLELSADLRRSRRGLGGVDTRPRRPKRHVGRAIRAGLFHS